MPPFAESQNGTIGFNDNIPGLFAKQNDNGKAGKSIAASGVWDDVTYSEGTSFFDRILDFNFCCSLDNTVGSISSSPNQIFTPTPIDCNKAEEVNTDSVVVEQNFTSNNDMNRVNTEQKIKILKENQMMKSPIKKAEEAVHHRRDAAEQ